MRDRLVIVETVWSGAPGSSPARPAAGLIEKLAPEDFFDESEVIAATAVAP